MCPLNYFSGHIFMNKLWTSAVLHDRIYKEKSRKEGKNMENTQEYVMWMTELRGMSARYMQKQPDSVEAHRALLKQMADVIPPLSLCISRAEQEYWPRVHRGEMQMQQAVQLCAQDMSRIIRITKTENLQPDKHSEEALLRAWASLDYYAQRMDGSVAIQLEKIYVTLSHTLQQKIGQRKAAEEQTRREEEARKAAEQARREEEARRAAEEQVRREEEARKAAEEIARCEEAERIAAEQALREAEIRKAAEEACQAEEAMPLFNGVWEDGEERTAAVFWDQDREQQDENKTVVILQEEIQKDTVHTDFVKDPEIRSVVEFMEQTTVPIQPEIRDWPDTHREKIAGCQEGKKKLPKLLITGIAAVVVLVLLVAVLLPGMVRVSNMEKQIEALGQISLNSGADIAAAEEALAALSEKEQGKVENRQGLEDARQIYESLVVEQVIAEIGVVSIDSEAAIEAAEERYDGLSPEAQQLVSNAQTLHLARAAYDQIEEKVNDAVRAIDAIGTVTQDSGEAIRAARKAYDDLGENQKAVAHKLEVLEQAERLYTECCSADLYEQALVPFELGKYEEALPLFQDVSKKYPGTDASSNARKNAQECLYKLAEAATKKGDQYTAMKWIRDMDPAYANNEESRTLRESIEKKLQQSRPKTGQKIVDKIGWGWNELGVTAASEDVVVRVEEKDDPSKFMLIYVRAGEYHEIKVKDGQYRVLITDGKYWYNKDVGFGFDADYRKGKEILDLSTERSGRTVSYYIYYVHLGNPSKCWFTFTSITESDFWN